VTEHGTFRPSIFVLAGTNGAGKSSVAGARFRRRGGDYFNPDEATREILNRNPGTTLDQANSGAWLEGKRLLERAIARKLDFAFETTLGGNTIPSLLEQALDSGIEVAIWYVGLESPELHIARVRERVARGGHDIPEAKIRERYDQSRLNLIRLIPKLTELRLFDNSAPGDPVRGIPPKPKLILHLEKGKIVGGCVLDDVPDWAKPIVAAALRIA
jgi:predicted ABC-type ATPase